MTYVPLEILDRLDALEREVRQLRGRAQIRPAMNQILAGDVVIGEGGQLFAQTPGGITTFVVGQTPQGDWGVGMGREDGTAALTVGDDNITGAQMIRMQSRSGEVIAMDDAYADAFLGRPSMPIPMQATAGQMTGNTSMTTAWTGATRLMNAVIYAAFETYTPAGVTADLIFEDSVDGYATLDSWSASKDNGWTLHEFTIPTRHQFMSHVNYRLRHAIRSGSGGQIRTNCLGVYSRNTFTPDEAP